MHAERKILDQIPLISKNNKVKPFYIYKNFTSNNLRNTTEIIIDMVDEAVRNEFKAYKKIKNKKNIRINFDDFATVTNYNVDKICKF